MLNCEHCQEHLLDLVTGELGVGFAWFFLMASVALFLLSAAMLNRLALMLAIPALVQSGVLEIAHEVYASIGPAFYGLRTSIVTFLLMALLRVTSFCHIS